MPRLRCGGVIAGDRRRVFLCVDARLPHELVEIGGGVLLHGVAQRFGVVIQRLVIGKRIHFGSSLVEVRRSARPCRFSLYSKCANSSRNRTKFSPISVSARPALPTTGRQAAQTAPRTVFFSKLARKTKAEVKKMIDFATRVSYNINNTCVANIIGDSL